MEEISGQTSAPTKQESSGLITLLDGVALLCRSRRVLYLCVAAGTLAGATALLLPPTYSAEAVIMPPQSSGSAGGLASQLESLSSLAGASGMGGLSSLKSNQELYVSLLQSSTVQDAFLAKFHLAEEYRTSGLVGTRKALKKHLDVDGTGKDGLIRITFSDHNSQRAADLANGYVQVFQQFSGKLAVSEASQRREFYESQLEEEKNRLTQAEESLRKSQQASGAVQLDAQARALIQSASSIRAQVAAKEVQVQSIRAHANSGNVELIEAEQELTALRAELAKVSSNDPDSAAGMLVSKSELPQRELDYIRTTRDLKYHETLFAILSRQLESARLDEAKQGTASQVIDAARPLDRPTSPTPILKITFGALLGFVIGLLIVFAKSFKDKITVDPEVRKRLQVLRRSATGL